MIDSKKSTVAVNNDGDQGGGYIKTSFRHDTTFNVGDLIPIFAMHTLPKDKISIKINDLIRTTSPPLRPTMDYMVQDVYAFWVSNYNILNAPTSNSGLSSQMVNNVGGFSWTQFMGENRNPFFIPVQGQGNGPSDMHLPMLRIERSIPGVLNTRLSNYLGINARGVGGEYQYVNCLKHLAYRHIWNEFFRDWNFQAPVGTNIDINSWQLNGGTTLRDSTTGQIFLPSSNFIGNSFESLLPVNRLDDYFSRALPMPQRFSGILTGSNAGLPVFAGTDFANLGQVMPSNLMYGWDEHSIRGTNPVPSLLTPPDVHSRGLVYYGGGNFREYDKSSSETFSESLYAGRINTDWLRDLEYAYMLFNLYEINARSPLYSDIIRNHFGVSPSNVEINRPVFLGKIRNIITATQVENTAGGAGELGDVGAFTKVANDGFLFTSDFDDYGVLMILTCVRCHRSYQFGCHPEDIKYRQDHFHRPVLNNLPYQPIYEDEIYLHSYQSVDDFFENRRVFGWKPAWDEYQYFPDRKSGMFLSTFNDYALDEWHYAENYLDTPRLSSTWLIESPAELSRTLAVPDLNIAHQLQYESLLEISGYRPVTFHKHEKGRKF